MEQVIRCAVLTISTRSSRGERNDTAGPALVRRIEATIGDVSEYLVLPDDPDAIGRELIRICDAGDADIVFTLGGTGLAPSDHTPEATEAVIERRTPGIAEYLRARSVEKTNRAILSRATAGVRARSLVVNLPGSERAVIECFEFLLPVIDHAVELLRGRVEDCGRPVRGGGA
jgi:molybdenum cofactor synthesis domain-containing protein